MKEKTSLQLLVEQQDALEARIVTTMGAVGRCEGASEATCVLMEVPDLRKKEGQEPLVAKRRSLRPGAGRPERVKPPLASDDATEVFRERFEVVSEAWRELSEGKNLLRSLDDDAWRKRELPSAGFTEQFYGCCRELDEAGNLTERHLTFLDLGCAPGGFSLYFLEKGLTGVGVTLPAAPGFHAVDPRLLEAKNYDLRFLDCTVNPSGVVFGREKTENAGEISDFYDVVVAGARFSRVGKKNDDDSEATLTLEKKNAGDPTRRLLTAQLLVAFRHLKPDGSLVVVLNITPTLPYACVLCVLRENFREVIAVKPASNFQYISSCYVVANGFVGPSESLDIRLAAAFARLDAGLDAPCAPLVDVCAKDLLDNHQEALQTLLEPLWRAQNKVIRDLLATIHL